MKSFKNFIIQKKLLSSSGVTLLEILSATIILVVILTTTLSSFTMAMQLSELAKNYTTATNAAKTIFETIKSTAFNLIYSNYNDTTFTIQNLKGRGVVYVDNSDPQMLLVTIAVCWQESNGRIIGEDKDLNGQVNLGEDFNNNGIIDSPIQISSYIYDTQ